VKASDALKLPNDLLATLYSYWSEETYCAGWDSYGARSPEFIDWLLSGACHETESDYVRRDLVRIGDLLAERAAAEGEK
jgi:hypothetical protein